MFKFIERMKLGIKQKREDITLQKQERNALRGLRQKKQFEINKTDLERQVELEELKAEVRKNQAKSQPKPGQKVQEKKSAFAAFQDYCTDFAQRQQSASAVGGLGMGGFASPYDKPKRQKQKKKIKNNKVKMVYVPMNQLGSNVKTIWR